MLKLKKMYQNMFDNITYEAQNWLPGVNVDTGMLDGSVRTYENLKGITRKAENHSV